MLTLAKLTCFTLTLIAILLTGLCSSEHATLSSSQNASVFSGCKKVILDENICKLFNYCEDHVTVCKIFFSTIIKPQGYLMLNNVNVEYNLFTNKYYANILVKIKSSKILQEIAKMPEYLGTTVSYLKVTHVRFLPAASDFYGIRNEVKLNEEWMPVEPGNEKFLTLQFIVGSKEVGERIVEAVTSTKDGLPGKIIQEVVQMEIKTENSNFIDSPITSLQTPVVEDKMMIIDLDDYKNLHKVLLYQQSQEHKLTLLPYLPDKQWILMQRRDTPGVDFNRNWKDYKTGFGSWENDFWLGLEKIHQITKDGGYGLRMEFESYKRLQRSAQWENFRVGSEEEKYKLIITGFDTKSSVGVDMLAYANGARFATVDKDDSNSCAEMWGGGWWFNRCMTCHFNNQLRSSIGDSYTCVHYYSFKGYTHARECLKRVRMFIIRH